MWDISMWRDENSNTAPESHTNKDMEKVDIETSSRMWGCGMQKWLRKTGWGKKSAALEKFEEMRHCAYMTKERDKLRAKYIICQSCCLLGKKLCLAVIHWRTDIYFSIETACRNLEISSCQFFCNLRNPRSVSLQEKRMALNTTYFTPRGTPLHHHFTYVRFETYPWYIIS